MDRQRSWCRERLCDRKWRPHVVFGGVAVACLIVFGIVVGLVSRWRQQFPADGNAFANDPDIARILKAMCKHRPPLPQLRTFDTLDDDDRALTTLKCLVDVDNKMKLLPEDNHPNCYRDGYWRTVDFILRQDFGDKLRNICVSTPGLGLDACPLFRIEELRTCEMCQYPATGQRAAALANSFRRFYGPDANDRLQPRARLIDGDVYYSVDVLLLRLELRLYERSEIFAALAHAGAIAEVSVAQVNGSWLEKELHAATLSRVGIDELTVFRLGGWTGFELYWALRIENFCARTYGYDDRENEDDIYRLQLRKFIKIILARRDRLTRTWPFTMTQLASSTRRPSSAEQHNTTDLSPSTEERSSMARSRRK